MTSSQPASTIESTSTEAWVTRSRGPSLIAGGCDGACELCHDRRLDLSTIVLNCPPPPGPLFPPGQWGLCTYIPQSVIIGLDFTEIILVYLDLVHVGLQCFTPNMLDNHVLYSRTLLDISLSYTSCLNYRVWYRISTYKVISIFEGCILCIQNIDNYGEMAHGKQISTNPSSNGDSVTTTGLPIGAG